MESNRKAQNTFCTVKLDGRSVPVSLAEAEELCPEAFVAMLEAQRCLRSIPPERRADLERAKAALLERMEMLRLAVIANLNASM